MLETLKNAWKVKELRNKILFTILILLVFRIGSVIPVPYIDVAALRSSMSGSDTNQFFSYLSVLTGGGLEYGYSVPIGRTLNLDFGIGAGYLGGEYKVYEPIDNHYVWKETRQRHWFGPTKAEISLVWLIGNKAFRKGGAR